MRVNAVLSNPKHPEYGQYTLTPIVAKLSDMRIVNGDLENMVFEPRKEFIVMQILVLGNIPLLYFLNQEWYDIKLYR